MELLEYNCELMHQSFIGRTVRIVGIEGVLIDAFLCGSSLFYVLGLDDGVRVFIENAHGISVDIIDPEYLAKEEAFFAAVED